MNRVVHYNALVSVLQLHNGYYHWVTERLPALCLVVSLFLKSDSEAMLLVDLSFHGSTVANAWCLEYLEMLGIPPERIIKYDPTVVYSCDILYVTSPIPAYSTHRGLLHLVRQYFLSAALASSLSPLIKFNNNNQQHRMMLIDRTGSKVRRSSTWVGLQQHLSRQYPSWSIDIVALHHMTAKEQIQLFQVVDVIVGVHGAGLANVMWCRPKVTTVVEIVTVNPPQVRHLFWHLATSLDLKYCPIHVMSSWNDPVVKMDVHHLVRRLSQVMEADMYR